jgi:hypothetical protein
MKTWRSEMRRYSKYIGVAGALVALAVPSIASANVAVDANGVGSIGKGDVQNALGYANDAAFQADASHITFSLAPNTRNYLAVGTECGTVDGGVITNIHTIDPVVIGSAKQSQTPNITTLKTGAGKVTGYTANGITAGDWTSGPMNYNVGTYCPAGEHFAGWADAAHVFGTHQDVPGSSVLQVSNGTKTVALSNTPVATP